MMPDWDQVLLVVLVFLWSSGLQAEEVQHAPLRLVGGAARCAGVLELLQEEGEWRRLSSSSWTLKEAHHICQEMNCGAAVSLTHTEVSKGYMWCVRDQCVRDQCVRDQCVTSGAAVAECVRPCVSTDSLEITCSDSVRLVNGTSLCSGRLEVKSAQSNQSWSSVCEAAFDQQDAEVVCRELGCGAPSVLQGALYGEGEAPMWTKEFQCGGDESSLLDCRSSDRNSCSPGRAVGLTCSEPLRLVGGSSRCAGTLEMKQGEWRPVEGYHWNLEAADQLCRQLDCGSALSESRLWSPNKPVWMLTSECIQSLTTLRDCVTPYSSPYSLEITCTDSVRLVNGTNPCSGRLEVRSAQSNQSWSSVCEAAFDQQDAEVVCRELGCGAPSVLQGALYGEGEAPMWTKEFQCGGDESSLLDCRSSDRNSCSPGRAVGLTCSEPLRLEGGSSRCAGTLEMKYEAEWRPVSGYSLTLKEAALFCRELDCGSALSVKQRQTSSQRPHSTETWEVKFQCLNSGSALRDCVGQGSSSTFLEITCSDSVRLVNGTSLCSGRLEVKSAQSNQSWSSVCEAAFDQQDAEVVCRELGCGAPSVLQGALYGEGEAPMWTKEFQCGGDESSLLDCRSSDRNSCSPGRAVGLTCSEPLRLVGGSSRCNGTLEVKQGEWRPLHVKRYSWTLEEAASVCRELDCGSAVSVKWREDRFSRQNSWTMRYDCAGSGSPRRDCVIPHYQSSFLEITCTDSVRLVNGTNPCSGRLEVRSAQSNQSWSSVCEDAFDQQDAEVVCRELGCGAPSVLQGALYGEGEAPMWTKEFQCGGNESSLLDCRSSDRNSCSPGRAVGLTCSEIVRLVGGSSRCNGTLEMKSRDWRPGDGDEWTWKEAAVICEELGCGSAVSVESKRRSSHTESWSVRSECVDSGSALKDCIRSSTSFRNLEITCLDSVRLVNGTNPCSGRLEVKSAQSNQSWSSVCEAAFDQQDAEVVCRELGCGAPSVLQGALYGEGEAPMWTKEFRCGGDESSLLDCRSSDRNSCSPGRAVGLTCSEPLRLVGGSSRCNGTLEMKQGEWRPVSSSGWTLTKAALFCQKLGCGSIVSTESRLEPLDQQIWTLRSKCVDSGSSLKDCVTTGYSHHSLVITCSDSVRLVNGTNLCSGRLEVKSDQSNQSWSSVCEAAFGQQDAEVVCREVGCGAPSVLQGALYGEGEAPMWTKEFRCGGDESSLLDCRSSDRNSCSPGRAVGLTCSEPLRLVGGSSRCNGTLEMRRQNEWRPVYGYDFTATEAAVFCRELDCGSAVSAGKTEESSKRPVWWLTSTCVHSESTLRDCVVPQTASFTVEMACLESVRLVNGTSLCSGRLEVKSDQSNQSWSSVCEAAFDQQDAEVVCRELGCGAPSVLQGALYGEGEAPMWTKEFQCGGDESSLLDCRSSDRNSCSPGRAVGLTCSEPLRLVGGSSRCAGTLEMKYEAEWRPVSGSRWALKEAAVMCRRLDCGLAVSVERKKESPYRNMWAITPVCLHSGSALSHCVSSGFSSESLEVTCSDSVRLVDGTSLCSGRLEVKSAQSNQSWSSVCEAAFDQQDAEVVCRELGCGAPSVLQGALYGEGEAPMWTKEFQCGGDESSLLDCRSSDRNSCSPGRAVGLTCSEPLRLVGGSSRCAGTLETRCDVEWRPVVGPQWTLKEAAVICRQLDCGIALSVERKKDSSYRQMWMITPGCIHSRSAWKDCAKSDFSSSLVEVTCSDSVRLVDGTSLCSGRLEVRSDQSNQSWSSVCEAAFDQQDAEVVCRELDCGAPSVLQGVLYGEGEAPMWTKEFQCGGDESSLLDCRSSDRNSCSPGRAVGLTCSEPLRLVGGSSRCAGILEMKHGEWRPVSSSGWTLKEAVVICREMDCGSAVSVGWTKETSSNTMWKITSECVHSGSALSDCVTTDFFSPVLEITCSDSVRLVDGTSLCSGRLEVKSAQSNQSWSSVCEAAFDQQDAEVVCRELGCGAPSVLQGALYGEGEAPMWTKEFQCGGDESSLLDCRSSDRNSCSPGRAVGLTCSEPLRLVGGSSRCAGTLEMKLRDWRPVSSWRTVALKEAAVFCRQLDCGSVVSVESKRRSSNTQTWSLRSECVVSGSNLKDCVTSEYSKSHLEITCSDSVRLVNGTSRCSGRLEVKSAQSNQSWSSVCEAAFDQQDAEVVCRELGCGAPSVLQGALYGEGEAPMWTKEFQCGGDESSLLDCRSSDRNSCSPGRAVGLTCSEPLRLVGGSSRCNGTLEVKHMEEWRSLFDWRNVWTLKEAAVFCRQLDCGSAVSVTWQEESSERPRWIFASECVHEPVFALRDCVTPTDSSFSVGITCSDALLRPIISVSSMDVVSEALQQEFQVIGGNSFTITCSIQPRHPGGSFLLTLNSFSTSHNFTQPAVNHSASFLFPAADPTHQGNFSCVYHVRVLSHHFSSESRPLSLTVSVEKLSLGVFPPVFIFCLVLLLLSLLLYVTGVYSSCKANEGQTSAGQTDTGVL